MTEVIPKLKERSNSFSRPEPLPPTQPKNVAVFETSLEDTFISFWIDFPAEKSDFEKQKEIKMFDLVTSTEKKLLQVWIERNVLRFKYL